MPNSTIILHMHLLSIVMPAYQVEDNISMTIKQAAMSLIQKAGIFLEGQTIWLAEPYATKPQKHPMFKSGF